MKNPFLFSVVFLSCAFSLLAEPLGSPESARHFLNMAQRAADKISQLFISPTAIRREGLQIVCSVDQTLESGLRAVCGSPDAATENVLIFDGRYPYLNQSLQNLYLNQLVLSPYRPGSDTALLTFTFLSPYGNMLPQYRLIPTTFALTDSCILAIEFKARIRAPIMQGERNRGLFNNSVLLNADNKPPQEDLRSFTAKNLPEPYGIEPITNFEFPKNPSDVAPAGLPEHPMLIRRSNTTNDQEWKKSYPNEPPWQPAADTTERPCDGYTFGPGPGPGYVDDSNNYPPSSNSSFLPYLDRQP